MMRTSMPDMYALGERAEHHGICYGLAAHIFEQGSVMPSIIGAVLFGDVTNLSACIFLFLNNKKTSEEIIARSISALLLHCQKVWCF
ncbi:hypothetical protein C5G87_16330 [Paenibacillus peoriae]|nr:hypothetical protein C5G87_16330 [Paenibacillus peoriae]